MNRARVHIWRCLLVGATLHEMLAVITTAVIPGGVPAVWHGATMLKEEMEGLGISYDERYDVSESFFG
jgi:alkylhydroperoxidase/carboxymuconolactone decarboxylase family protein YurZ